MPLENWLEAFGFKSENERPNEGKRIAFEIDFDGCKSIFVSDWETQSLEANDSMTKLEHKL